MYIPLDFSNIVLWFTMTSMILLITLEFTSNYYGRTNLQIDRKRLQNVTIIVFTFFLISLALTAVNIIVTPYYEPLI
jgi:hypothetical protein